MIRFGIAGIPLTSKGRTFIESVEDANMLGLNALEVQLLRVNVEERTAIEYSGLTPRDNEQSIIVNVLRQDSDGNYQSVGIDTVIEEDDIVQELFWNMARNYDELETGGKLARELDVQLSLHAPYYMDLLDDGEVGDKSRNHLHWSMIIGKAMMAKRVITHTGFYKKTKKESLAKAVDVFGDLAKELPADRKYPVIGAETSGKPDIFGTVQETIALAKKVKDIEPILNFAHVHSLGGGSLIEVKDFSEVISEFRKYAKGDLYTEFAGVDYEDNTELKLTAIKHGDLKFETLTEALLDYDGDLTLISMSPLLEHDAQYMDLIYLRTLSRKFQRKPQVKKAA
ncbi:MAG: TIM barrel protein [Candidatus Thermoplasmatota archaeon]|jgi:deoxyribonuclease-4|nr:TIM barrel protein [Candidatus Thermoplasmatota archaeon]MCL5793920.1 TIM barrel protein [Candidatus Thermoplasmatota archaeon]